MPRVRRTVTGTLVRGTRALSGRTILIDFEVWTWLRVAGRSARSEHFPVKSGPSDQPNGT